MEQELHAHNMLNNAKLDGPRYQKNLFNNNGFSFWTRTDDSFVISFSFNLKKRMLSLVLPLVKLVLCIFYCD